MATLMEDKLKALLMGAGATPANANPALSSMYSPGSTPQQPPISDISQDPVVPPPTQVASAPAVQRAPAQQASNLQLAGGMSHIRQIQDALRQKLQNAQDEQQGTIDLGKQALANQYARTQDIDWSPAYDLIKAAGGSKDAGSTYKKPVDQMSNDAELRDALSKQQKGMSDTLTAQLKDELQNKLLGNQFQQNRMDLMRERLDQGIYGKQIMGLRNDKTLNDLVGKNNSITRTADVLFAPGQDLNTTSLHDLQQTVTGALTGLQGGGGVGERAERYMSDMETALGKLKQQFGDTNSIPRDNSILQHYLKLASDGQQFLQDQAQKRIETLAAGHEDVTSQPKYNDMFNNELGKIKGNISKPQYLQSSIIKTAKSPPGANPANAGSPVMDQDTFIQKFLAAKKAQNGGK